MKKVWYIRYHTVEAEHLNKNTYGVWHIEARTRIGAFLKLLFFEWKYRKIS